jgi:hypothetical protein
MKGIKITGYIEPVSLLDSYPTHLDNFGKGGVHSVASLVEREAIFLERRSLGMMAFDTTESSMYGLFGGLDNTGWVKLFDYKDNKLNFNIFCDTNYILLGDENNIAKPSPILIDVRQDIIDLKRQIGHFETLSYHKIWIGNELNKLQETLQISTINLPTLGAAVFPLPNLVSNLILDIPIPNPTFNPLSLSDWIMSGPWLPQIFAGSVNTLNTSSEIKVSSSLAMTQIRTAKNFKLFDNASFIVANKEVSFLWDNPAYLLTDLSDNLKKILELYNLGTSYTFTKAQSLGDLETGLIKNTVDNGTGTLSKAISGEDYVNTADILAGNLVMLDPLYPTIGHKLIAPTDLNVRGNDPGEFGITEPNTVNVLVGTAAKFDKLAATSIENDTLTTILTELAATAAVVKSIIGVAKGINITAITTKEATALTNAVKNAIGLETTAEILETTEKAADLLTNKAALVEIEAQIAALAGVVAISDLIGIFSIGALAVTGYNYGQYIKGQSINTNNQWYSVDNNDDASNATGELRPLEITPFKNSDRGHGAIWFDSKYRDDSSKEYEAEGGLRLFSWDSSGLLEHKDALAPIHIGLFGYKKNYLTADEYKGFIFRSKFSNDSSNDNYRFPINFGLYDVHKQVHSYVSGYHYGWDKEDTIFEYDYNNFNFYKDVKFKSTGAVKIPVGTNLERPLSAEVGMIRYNKEL